MLNAITITSMYVLDQDAAVDFYVGKLGFEVKVDQQFGPMRFLTVALPDDPDHAVLLELPAPPSVSPDVAEQVRDLVSKGAGGGWLTFTTDDVHGMFAKLEAAGVDITQEPMEQPYGTDFGILDPFGNPIRIGTLNA